MAHDSDNRKHPGDGSASEAKTEFHRHHLPPEVLQGIVDAGFSEMTAIQRLALPHILEGSDLAAQAQTGTGKTATFLIGLYSRILVEEREPGDSRPLVLIMAPTRELALQIHREAELLGAHTGLRMAAIYGGEGYGQQEKALRTGVDMVVGTPGRLLDFIRRKVLDLSRVRYLVIDEADRLLDLGFWDELRQILRRLPPADRRQSMLFSATLDSRTKRIVHGHMNPTVDVEVEPERITAEGIDQTVYHVDRDMKFRLLLGILSREEIPKGMLFANMKVTAAWLVKKLKDHGYQQVDLLTGDLRQNVRNRVLERFKAGKTRLLIASDVASRGLHIDDVTHIINYDVPQDPEDYVHRIGRTARAGKRGKAYTLACDEYVFALPEIEKLLGEELPYRIPYEEDYGEEKDPRFTVREMIRQERRQRDGSAGRRGSSRGPGGRGGERKGRGSGGKRPRRRG